MFWELSTIGYSSLVPQYPGGILAHPERLRAYGQLRELARPVGRTFRHFGMLPTAGSRTDDGGRSYPRNFDGSVLRRNDAREGRTDGCVNGERAQARPTAMTC